MMAPPSGWRLAGVALATAVAASLLVLLAGMILFGFQVSQWAEWEGRLVGLAGAAVGLWSARRKHRHG